MSKLHCVTLNVRGLRDKVKRKCIVEWAKQQKADVLMLQETHVTDDIVNEFDKDWSGLTYHSFGSSRARGVSILFRKGLKVTVTDVKRDSEGRKLAVSADFDGHSYVFTCVYAPTHDKCKEQCTFFHRLREWLAKNCSPAQLLVIGGDFNIPFDPNIDRTGASNINKKVTKAVSQLCRSLNIVDVWRMKHPEKQQYTYRCATASSRIDYWLVSKTVSEHLYSDIRPAVKTDHNAVSLKIQVPNAKRGPGYWKLNVSFLKEQDYNTMIINVVQHTKQHAGDLDNRRLWDLCKVKIKQVSIEYGRNKAKDSKSQLGALQSDVLKAEAELLSVKDADTLEQYANAKDKLDEYCTVKARGAQVRSRAQWYEHGERNTGYFLGLERMRAKTNNVSRLKTQNGKDITDPMDILSEEVTFYKHLYASRKICDQSIQTYLDNIELDHLISDEQQEVLEGKLTDQECVHALKKMKLNRSPGGDGIPIDFYIHFWDTIKELVLNSLNEGYDNTELSITQKTAVLKFIYKKGDRSDLSNWRPISLLNGDYKLAAQVLANRLQSLLGDIINSDQSGYVRGRFIGNNIRLINDIIDLAEQQSTGGAILFLDFKKAFDSLEKNFLFAVLEKFNVGNSFMQWVKTLYNGANSTITNNGWTSARFEMERGIRQGCPLSALLFILAVEILAIAIRKDQVLEGIHITNHSGTKEIRLCQLADDTTIFVKNPAAVHRALIIVDNFGLAAGLELNRNKTEGMWLGVDKTNEDVGDIVWSTEPIKALGVFFGHDKILIESKNWDAKVKQLRDTLQVWQKRNLTMFGRITIVKTLGLSKLLYNASVLPVPTGVVTEVNKAIFQFIWNYKSEKIKRRTLIGETDKGGLNMVDFGLQVEALKTKWVQRLLSSEDECWAHVACAILGIVCPNLEVLFHANFLDVNRIPMYHQITPFYRDVLKAWCKCKAVGEVDVKLTAPEIRFQLIWGNDLINARNKVMFFNSWIRGGFIFINDICTEVGFLSTNTVQEKLSDNANVLVEFKTILEAIPKQWRETIKSNACTLDGLEFSVANIINDSGSVKHVMTKDVCKALRAKHFVEPIIKPLWEKVFKRSITWNDVWRRKVCIKENKLAQFNFKLLYNILPNMRQLTIWKILHDENCILCNIPEDAEHLFVHCRRVKTFWLYVNQLIRRVFKLDVICSWEVILLGTDNENLNLVVTIAAFAVFKTWAVADKNVNLLKTIDISKMFLNEIAHRAEIARELHDMDNICQTIVNQM